MKYFEFFILLIFIFSTVLLKESKKFKLKHLFQNIHKECKIIRSYARIANLSYLLDEETIVKELNKEGW
jgi:hypothetical protein